MGESSSFLVRSPTSEGKKENTMQRALTTSISFGKFMSESLDWGKWSVFTHSRYMEEVERYSRPGAVAEKKAYFEAHFKRRRAEKLLEQENAALRERSDADSFSPLDVNMEHGNGDQVNATLKEEEAQSNDFSNENHGCSSETAAEDSCPMDVEPCAHVENQHLEMGKEAFEDKRCNKDGSTLRAPTPPTAKKQEVFPRSPFVRQKIDQLKNSCKSPGSRNTSRDSGIKRPSYATSLHMSFNLGSSSGIQKNPSPRVTRPPAKSYKSSSHSQTSSRVSVNDMNKSQSANKGTLARHGDSVIRNEGSDSQSGSKGYSQAANNFSSNALSPQFSPFTFKTEERAEKRKEFLQKLEEKLKLKESDKQRMHVKSQVKARSLYEDLHDTLMFRTEKATDGTSVAKLPINSMKEIPTVRPSSSKAEEGIAFKAQDLNSRPPWKLPSRVPETKDVHSKNRNAAGLLSQRSFSKRNMNENAPPNIYN